MLQRWVATDESDLASVSSDESRVRSNHKRSLSDHEETSEARESRLCQAYEKALKLQQSGSYADARHALRTIMTELDRDDTASKGREKKRAKGSNVGVRDWERRLRYVTNKNLGEVCLLLGDGMEAYERFRAALEDDRGDVMLWLKTGRAAAAIGRLHIARTAYEEGLKVRPDHWLCAEGLAGVLAAIGDDDMDFNGRKGVVEWSKRKIHQEMAWQEGKTLLGVRFQFLKRETACLEQSARLTSIGFKSDDDSLAFIVLRTRLTWENLVNELINNLEKRLAKPSEPIGAPVVLEKPSTKVAELLETHVISSDTSSEVEVVEVPVLGDVGAKDGEDGTKPQETHESKLENEGPASTPKSIGNRSTGCASATDNEEHSERRRSKRQEEREQRYQQATVEKLESAQRYSESNLLAAVLAFVTSKIGPKWLSSNIRDHLSTTRGEERAEVSQVLDFSTSREELQDAERDFISDEAQAWATRLGDPEEQKEIDAFLNGLETANGGPVDVLCRIFDVLTRKETLQYSDQISSIWIILRPHNHLSFPGTLPQTARVVEALLLATINENSSPEAVREIGRLLSLLPKIPGEIELREDEALGVLSSRSESFAFCARLEWLRSVAACRRGDFLLSYKHCEQCLHHFSEVRALGNSHIPSVGGPCFGGASVTLASSAVREKAKNLRRSAELKAAQRELKSFEAGTGGDISQIIAILLPSVLCVADELGLVDDKGSSGVQEEAKRPFREPRVSSDLVLSVQELMRACEIIKNDPGEMIARACQLRLSVLDYERFAAPEQDPEYESSAAVELAHAELQKIVHQLKPLSSLIKRSTQTPSEPKNYGAARNEDNGIQINLREATIIMMTALCYAAHILEKEIPIISTSLRAEVGPLNPFKKNLRLALSRALLGFTRCYSFAILSAQRKATNKVGQGDQISLLEDYEKGSTRNLVVITRYFLKRLAPRGCLREEGTSGALLKLYASYLRDQILVVAKESETGSCLMEAGSSLGSHETEQNVTDFEYSWDNIFILRKELAHCYRCLYKIPDLEALDSSSTQERWLLDGCKLSSKLGLGNSRESPTRIIKAYMDQATCNSLYVFYRRRFLKAMRNNWRDGKRSRRARDAVRDLLEVLPVKTASDIPCLTDSKLVEAVSATLEQGTDFKASSERAISSLKSAWIKALERACERSRSSGSAQSCKETFSSKEGTGMTRNSRMHYELYVLNAMSEFTIYEAEFKKHRQTERRKSPSEAIERLIKCQGDCVAALRFKPWSVGAWLALGRIFLEVTDVNLDERELLKTPFGRTYFSDKESSSWLDLSTNVLNRAEGCFRLAQALATSDWAKEEPSFPSYALDAESHDGSFRFGVTEKDSYGEHDFFGRFGVTRNFDQRGRDLLLASALFGLTFVRVFRIQEEGYAKRHWMDSTLVPHAIVRSSAESHKSELRDVNEALNYLEEGMSLAFKETSSVESNNCFAPYKWFYLLQRAKLGFKAGKAHCLDIFAQAVQENERRAKVSQQEPDIEPVYKLHMTRLKLLLQQKRSQSSELLEEIEKHSFGDNFLKDGNFPIENVETRLLKIATDIVDAMTFLGPKHGQAYSEYFFKAVYAKALVKWKIMNDKRAALKQIGDLFRSEQATVIAQSGSDAVHRGYFYLAWNYRYTDTGIEPTIESERKFLRWRCKLLGAFAALLNECSEAWTLFGGVSRLKRRLPEDCPTDGASLDDLLLSCADSALAEFLESTSRHNIPMVAYAEKCLRRSWEIYTESVRLEQGAKRALSGKDKVGDDRATTLNALHASKRPWCLGRAGLLLFLEYRRWRAARGGRVFQIDGQNVTELSNRYKHKFPFEKIAKAVDTCMTRLKADNKAPKVLKKRLKSYFEKKSSEVDAMNDISVDLSKDGPEEEPRVPHEILGSIKPDSIDILEDSINLKGGEVSGKNAEIESKKDTKGSSKDNAGNSGEDTLAIVPPADFPAVARSRQAPEQVTASGKDKDLLDLDVPGKAKSSSNALQKEERNNEKIKDDSNEVVFVSSKLAQEGNMGKIGR